MGMCTSKTSSTTSVPGYVSDASADLVSKATDLSNKPYDVAPLQIADFTPDQEAAFDQIRQTAADPAIATSRVVDENGPLGKISDYMDPYAAMALDPAREAAEQEGALQRKQLGASATSAGAFGDARHGIDESQINFNTQKAVGDITKTGMADAFNQAMANRQTDLSRFTDVDKTNFTNALQATQALLTSGNEQQGEEQAKNQAIFDNFLAQYGHDFDVLSALESAIGGVKDTTTTTGKTDSGAIMSLLGSAVGGFSSGAGKAAGTAAVAAV